MELCSFWVISPADGQDGKPEPIKIIFFENGDTEIISLSEDPDYWGAYRLPSGSYQYTGKTIHVAEENFSKVIPLVNRTEDVSQFRASLFSSGLINEREWEMFYANRKAWDSLRILAVTFGDEPENSKIDSEMVGEDNG